MIILLMICCSQKYFLSLLLARTVSYVVPYIYVCVCVFIFMHFWTLTKYLTHIGKGYMLANSMTCPASHILLNLNGHSFALIVVSHDPFFFLYE